MTKLEFMCECGQRLIDPSLALENENIEKALIERDSEKVIALLESEF